MKTATRFCRILLIVSAAFAVNTRALGQPEFTKQPEDQTVKPSQRLLISVEIRINPNNELGIPTVTQAYRGVNPDTSDPLPDSALTSIAPGTQTTMTFSSGPLTETTQFWLHICSSFGCADSRTFTFFVESDELPVPPAFQGAQDLGDDWRRSPWFGDFNVAFSDSGWIFHAQHEWMYIWEDSSPSEMYVYDHGSDQWLYTAAETYPNLYSFTRNSWVFYFEGTSGPREFGDLQNGAFFTIP